MLIISYIDHATNEEVLCREGVKRKLLKMITKRQFELLGHITERMVWNA
jgi:hypothetical protein